MHCVARREHVSKAGVQARCRQGAGKVRARCRPGAGTRSHRARALTGNAHGQSHLQHERPLPLHGAACASPATRRQAALQGLRWPHVPEAEREELNQYLRSEVAAVVVAHHVRQQVGHRGVHDQDERIQQRRTPRA